MATASRTNEDDATRGLTLRELVLRVEGKVDRLGDQFDNHMIDHANKKGQQEGGAQVFGMARSTIAIIVSVVSATVATAAFLGDVLASSAK